MNLICLAALIAACGAAKLDRTYLPPLSAASAGGSPGSLQTPFTRTSDQSHIIPPGGFINEHEGVVVEATLAGTRASNNKTGLGGSRESYGSTSSKVGDAAFRTTTPKPQSGNQFQSNVYKDYDASKEADLSAFHQSPNIFKPENVQVVRDYVSDVIKYHNDIGLNKFNYGFETNNGIKTSANGIAIDGVRAQGGFSYTGDDGKEYSVSYIADEAGFRPQGSHLPTPHPIPAAILEALEQNARDEAAGIIDDGSYDAKKYNVEDDYSQSIEYNNRLSNKLGRRPGLDSEMATKQNQPPFGMPNFNRQFGFGFQTFMDKNIKPDAFKFHSGNKNDVKNIQTVSKYEQSSSMTSGFGSRNEYLPPKAVGNKYSFNVSPHSPQRFQEQNHFGIPHSSSMIPSSFGSSPGPISQGTFPLQSSSLASNIGNTQTTLSSFGAADKNYLSFSSQAHNKPFQGSSGVDFTSSTNPSISYQSTLSPGNDKVKPQNSQSSIPVSGFTSQSSQPSIQSEVFSSVSPPQSSQNTNGRLETTEYLMSTQYFNPSQYTTAYQTQYTNKPSSNFATSFSSVVATKQPDITLTTPLDETKTKEPSSSFDLNKSELLDVTNLPDMTVTNGQILQFQTSQTKETLPTASVFSTSSLNKNPPITSLDIDKIQTTQLLHNTQVTQDIFTQQRPGDSDFALNTQRPNYNTQSNVFTGQAQEADHSYIYKRPSVPFHTPVAIHQPNNFPNKPLLSHLDRVIQSMTTPLDSTISTQSLYTNNNFPNPSTITTLSPSFPTLAENDLSKTTFQASSDITQASISKFPPIVPTVSSTFKKPSNPFDLKPFQQFELNTPNLSKFTNDDTTVTATTFVQSTALGGNTVSSQSDGNTGTTKEIYEYNKPSQGLSSGTEKEEVDSSQKTEKPQFTIFSTQFSQENPTTMSLEGKDVQTDQQKPSIQSMQPNVKPEYASYNYKPSKFFPSTMTTDMFATENEGTQSSTINLSQKPIIELQTSTQFVNSDSRETTSNFQQTYQETTTQFDSKQSISNQGLFQTNPEQTHYTSVTEKLSTQLPTNQPTQLLETQSNTQVFDSKETTSNFQTPYQQTATQLDSKPSTSIPGLFQTIPGQTHYKPMTEKLLTQLPTNQPTQFETQSNTYFFDSKETTSTFQGPYQQTATQFDSKPSTSISGLFQTNPEKTHYTSVTEKLSTQLPSNQPTQFETQSNTQFFDSKETTSNFQEPYQQPATQFDSKPSTSISGLFQTYPEQTHYTLVTEKLSTQLPTNQPTQFETQSNAQFFDAKETTSNFQGPYQQTATQFDSKPSTSIPGLFQTNPGQIHYKLMTEKLSTQLPTNQPTQFETQSNTQFFDSKETTSNFQEPYQQTATQFDSKPSTSIPGLFQTNPSQTHYKPMTEKLSTQLPTNQPTQFETQSYTQFGQENFGNKATTATQYQQSVTQFNSKPTAINMQQLQDNAKNTGKQNEFSTSFDSTDETTQFTVQSTQEYQEIFDTKGTTTFQFQEPSKPLSTNFNEPSTLVTSTTQTASPPKTTQFGEIYDYTKPTQGLLIPSQNNVQINQEKPHFVNHIDTPLDQQTMPIFQREKPSQFEQQTPESHFNLQSNTQNIQEVNGQTGSLFTQPDSQSSVHYHTGPTSLPSTPQEQTTFDSRVSEQVSTTGEIYEYTKPTHGLMTTQNVNYEQMSNIKPQDTMHIDTQPGPQFVHIFQREKPTQLAQQAYFTSESSTENFSTENVTGTTVQQFTQTEQVTNKIFNTDSTPQDQNKQTLDQASTTGEIYEYTKPEQGLPSDIESVSFGHEIQMQSGIQTTKSDQVNESQPTIGQSTHAPTTTISISQTESKQNSQNQNTLTSQTQFTQGFESNKETFDSRPKLAFHKACCSKLKAQNNDDGSGNSLNGNNLEPNIGINIIENNNNISHLEISKQKETQANLAPEPSFTNLDPRKGSETYAGIGEKFGGPRKPPSFDETGYHY